MTASWPVKFRADALSFIDTHMFSHPHTRITGNIINTYASLSSQAMHVSLTVSCKESKMSLGVMSRTFSTAPWQHSTAFFTHIVQVRELDLYWAEQETWVRLYCHRHNLRVQQGAVAEERDNSVRHDRLFSFISLRYCRGQRQCRKDIVCVCLCV